MIGALLQFVRSTLRLLFWSVLLLLLTWSALAVWIDGPWDWLRWVMAGICGLVALAALLGRNARTTGLATLVIFGLTLLWWLSLEPRQDRAWQPDMARTPSCVIEGDLLQVRDLRQCRYRTEHDYTVHYLDRDYDLRRLRTVDFLLVHWGSPAIAHTMLSFVFDEQPPLCISIETRRERGEAYSALHGFFRQYELAYVVADEIDLVRLRTDHRRDEVVSLYRFNIRPEVARRLLLAYVDHINALHQEPEWYNALGSNCTTNLVLNAMQAAEVDRLNFDWRLLLNGDIDSLLVERGAFLSPERVEILREKGRVNGKGRNETEPLDYARAIRVGVPGIE